MSFIAKGIITVATMIGASMIYCWATGQSIEININVKKEA